MEQRSIQTGAGMIADERQRQLVEKGWRIPDDVRKWESGELGIVAVELIERDVDSFGIMNKCGGDRIRELVVAGALVAAEIDRLILVEDVGRALSRQQG